LEIDREGDINEIEDKINKIREKLLKSQGNASIVE
jgi:hypothetical protein